MLGLGLLLIVLPMGSWFFLDKGLDYQKQLHQEIKEKLGVLPEFKLFDTTGKIIEKEITNGNLIIASFIDINQSGKSEVAFKELHLIQSHFDKKENILFLTFAKADNQQQVVNFKASLKIKNREHWLFLHGEEEALNEIAEKIPFKNKTNNLFANNPTAILVDIEGNIRNYYNMKNRDEVARLIEHIAILMPKKMEEKAVVKREKEK